MIESSGSYIKRKIIETGSVIKRRIVFPLVKVYLERKYDSVICKGAYLFGGTSLGGQDYINEGAVLGNVKLGHHSYIGPMSLVSNTRIGNYTCIALALRTAYGRHPVKGENISIHPAFYSTAGQYGYCYVKHDDPGFEEIRFADKENGYNIVIGSDVWIGVDTVITDGVTIGNGAVVGARSFVDHDIEPYAIYAGTPAKKIGERFDEKTVKMLLDLCWWDKDEEWIREHAESFRNPGEFIKDIEEK